MTQLLPDKFVPLRRSLIGQGAEILALLRDRSWNPAELFVESRQRLPHLDYDNFVLTLDLLYAGGLITFGRGGVRGGSD